jgi:hypothetical protein
VAALRIRCRRGSADTSIVELLSAGVDVTADNTRTPFMFPPTPNAPASSNRGPGTGNTRARWRAVAAVSFRTACRSLRVQNAAVDVVTDNTAESLLCMTTSTHPATGRTIELSKSRIECDDAMTAICPDPKKASTMTDVNVLIIVGLPAGSVNRALAKIAVESVADGITLNVFDTLGELPRYSETLEGGGTPSSVGALRTAAAEADAVLVVTNYHRRIPTVVHNAINWLTERWDEAALHDKPLAIIGRAGGCYSGVWSHQTDDADGTARSRIIEPITVSTLREAVKQLGCEVDAGDEPSWATPASEDGTGS